jgi:DNA-binding NarL/FixJ family response regulator
MTNPTGVKAVLAAVDRVLPRRTPRQVPMSDGNLELGQATPELTARELEVSATIARGLTATACGHLSRISERTAQRYLENAYAKLLPQRDCRNQPGPAPLEFYPPSA